MNSKLNYIQLSVPQYAKLFPSRFSMLSPEQAFDLLHDPDYVVRLSPDLCKVEIGYPGDHWYLK